MGQQIMCECGDDVDYRVKVDGVANWCRDCVIDVEGKISWEPKTARAHGSPVVFILSLGDAGDMVEKYGSVSQGASFTDEACLPMESEEDVHMEAAHRTAQASLLGWELVSVSESNRRIYLWFRPSKK